MFERVKTVYSTAFYADTAIDLRPIRKKNPSLIMFKKKKKTRCKVPDTAHYNRRFVPYSLNVFWPRNVPLLFFFVGIAIKPPSLRTIQGVYKRTPGF